MEWRDGCDFLELAVQEGIDNIVFSANSVVNKHGLVMGKGAALRIRDAYPGITSDFGKILDRRPPGDYYVIKVSRSETPSSVYALQVKRKYRDPGDFELCRQSLQKLNQILGDSRAVMNCPLITNGGFHDEKERVYEMIENELENSPILVTRFDV
jgi:hypothetical protein